MLFREMVLQEGSGVIEDKCVTSKSHTSWHIPQPLSLLQHRKCVCVCVCVKRCLVTQGEQSPDPVDLCDYA